MAKLEALLEEFESVIIRDNEIQEGVLPYDEVCEVAVEVTDKLDSHTILDIVKEDINFAKIVEREHLRDYSNVVEVIRKNISDFLDGDYCYKMAKKLGVEVV